MIARLKKILASVSVGLLLAVSGMPFAVAQVHAADCLSGGSSSTIKDCLDSGITKTDPNAQGLDNASGRVDTMIKLVINIFSLVVGVISVIMIIIGGLKYITSGGDSGNVTGAKNTILYAIIGLIIVALAQIIVKFVLEKVSAQ